MRTGLCCENARLEITPKTPDPCLDALRHPWTEVYRLNAGESFPTPLSVYTNADQVVLSPTHPIYGDYFVVSLVQILPRDFIVYLHTPVTIPMLLCFV